MDRSKYKPNSVTYMQGKKGEKKSEENQPAPGAMPILAEIEIQARLINSPSREMHTWLAGDEHVLD